MYFVELANTLNFRKAAEKLGVSQPTLTAQISALEETVSLSLFERSRTGTFLSPQGRAVLASAKQLVTSMNHFEETAKALAEGPATTFRMGVPPTLGPYLLPFVLPDMHARYESLKLYVREEAPRSLSQSLLAGEYDLIISPLSADSPELSSVPLFTEPLKFVVPTDHRLSGEDWVSPQDIRGESVLILEEHHHFHGQVRDICASLGANVLRDFEGTSLDTLRQMVVMGIGVTFLPGLYIHSELHRPEALHVCELKGLPIMRQHSLVWRHGSPARVLFRELAMTLRQIIKQQLGDVVLVN
ncbi:hyaluronan synthase [Marinibactrum halimedae]|uniref:Hyaluronan synthase n=2 Tax=Marinibactrum halimedae TaxID=1444977 RepID=A0AA37T394_9GAMM|nr:hyaluronan synthase [Marinibactrum halimedae]